MPEITAKMKAIAGDRSLAKFADQASSEDFSGFSDFGSKLKAELDDIPVEPGGQSRSAA